jgi:hypothetical protein
MRIRRLLPRVIAVLLALLLLLVTISALVNRTLPLESEVIDKLSAAEKARVAEFFHLREQLGNQVWPGWGSADIPVIVYNEAYAFLIGYPDPPDGWIKVSQNQQLGGPWEPVGDDRFGEEVYYRQRLAAGGATPQAFTVRVGERWVASMTTMEWMEISLANQLREEMPPVLREIFPYPIVVNILVRGSDGYISALAHESFHAYQGIVAPQRLESAEQAGLRSESRYPWSNGELEQAWQVELDLLHAALEAPTEAEARSLAQQFLARRQSRRDEAHLSSELVAYEAHREWVEGLARYAELEIWHQAARSDLYEPLRPVHELRNFSDYSGFDRRWSQELDQLTRMAGDSGDGRFYYSGMAQAVLLDQLLPDWKTRALQEPLPLEALLAEAVGLDGLARSAQPGS